jgi:hypothetical protein
MFVLSGAWFCEQFQIQESILSIEISQTFNFIKYLNTKSKTNFIEIEFQSLKFFNLK